MNGYELSRAWFDFSFEKKEANVYHTSIFVWCIELNNRLGWKKEFGLPTQATMEGLSIGNKNTYLNALKDLESWGFVKVIKESKNQYQSCIISICHSESDTALYTALDTALIQHDTQREYDTVYAIDTIDKPINNKTINKETKKQYATLVMMLEKEFEKLVSEHGIDKVNWMVTTLDNYKVSKGKKYKDDYRAILSWVVGKAEKEYKGKQIVKPINIKPNGYPNPQVYYATCWQNKVNPVRFENGDILSETEIEEQHKLHKVGKYQYA